MPNYKMIDAHTQKKELLNSTDFGFDILLLFFMKYIFGKATTDNYSYFCTINL
ncbi:hypothetical protein BXY82_2716 [Gelidibacter sediminis]|uniref:Uncharacterized protein n=1 Tax=Gelidibacter sediminis TaxID=1608710 RepID=A0A4V6Q4G1_9FLAO|nr:hypothetical protein BXY82_2716 [Gelidibacter sediminis]